MVRQSTLRASRSDGARSRRIILDGAVRLAAVEGLDGLSIGRLADYIGMSKSGLYAHFGSKEELQLAIIDTAMDIFEVEVTGPAALVEDPLAHVEALCDHFLSYLERSVFPGGCFFAAVASEFDTHPGPVRDRIASLQADWMMSMQSLLEEAQANGSLGAAEDAEQLTFELEGYLLAANLLFVLQGDAGAPERGRRAVSARLARAAEA